LTREHKHDSHVLTTNQIKQTHDKPGVLLLRNILRNLMLAQIVRQCEKNSDPTTLKIVQSELGIRSCLDCP